MLTSPAILSLLLSLLLLPSHTRDSLRDYLGVSKPFFSPDTSQVGEVREGVTAYLPCQVYNRNNFSVSWIRNVQQNLILTKLLIIYLGYFNKLY